MRKLFEMGEGEDSGDITVQDPMGGGGGGLSNDVDSEGSDAE